MPGIITPSEIKNLVDFRSDGAYVVSFYLNIDGQKFPRKQGYEVKLKALLRKGEKDWLASGGTLSKEQKAGLREDFQKIDNFVRFNFTRQGAKGIAIFSCTHRGLWQVYPLPVAMPSNLIISKEPYAKTLLAVLDEYRRFCTVVVDRRKARIFTVYLGQIEEHFGVFEDDVPAKVKEGEWAGLRQTKIAHHIEDHVLRHLKRVAQKTLVFFKEHHFDRLILAGHKETIPKLKEVLHPYLLERVAGQLWIEPEAPLKEVLEKSLAVEERVEKKKEEELIKSLTEKAKPHGQGVIGLKATLEALSMGEVHTLLIGDGYAAKGLVCSHCNYLSPDLEECPLCGRKTRVSEDIIEDMVQVAIHKNCQVEHITHIPEFIKSIGALLRFSV